MAEHTYIAKSGVWVTTCVPESEDKWARGNVSYALHSYAHILKTVLWKEPRRARRLRREGKA